MTDTHAQAIVRIDYTNWRGERRLRVIRPQFFWFGSTEYHKQPSWLCRAIDGEDGKIKDFAMEGIHSWRRPTSE